MEQARVTATDTKIESTPGLPHAGQSGSARANEARTPQRARSAARPKPIIRGQDGTQWKDIYHWVLTVSWLWFFLVLSGFFILLNVFFALFYFADPHGLLNARPGNFWDTFFFSIQTIGSLNSPMLPKSDYARVVMSVEAFCGIVNLALVTGVIFARFSRPFARVIFSNVAVVVPFNGVPTLMFRAANQRSNVIFDANATVSLARQMTTAEGMKMRRFEELNLVRNRTPLFSLSWTVMHPIDGTSPLYGVDLDALMDQEMELIVLLSGTDETLSQVVYARQRYTPENILFDRRFVDILTEADSGRLEVDLHRIHDTEPSPPA